MSRRYSERTADGTTNPLKGADLIGVSNENGGIFDKSKKITMTQVANFLRSLFGLSIPDNIVPVGNAAGDGIEASTAIIEDLDANGGLHLSQENNNSLTAFLLHQHPVGDSTLNSKSNVNITINGVGGGLRVSASSVGISTDPTQEVLVGSASAEAAKFIIRGTTDDNTQSSLWLKDDSETRLFNVDNLGDVYLKSGTGVNEISVDGTAAGNSDDVIMTEKAIVTYVASQAGGVGAVKVVNTATYTVLSTDTILHVTRTTTGSCVITWPTALMISGQNLLIKDGGLNAGTNNIAVETEAAQTIDGDTNWLIDGDGDWLGLYSDGSNLFIKD